MLCFIYIILYPSIYVNNGTQRSIKTFCSMGIRACLTQVCLSWLNWIVKRTGVNPKPRWPSWTKKHPGYGHCQGKGYDTEKIRSFSAKRHIQNQILGVY